MKEDLHVFLVNPAAGPESCVKEFVSITDKFKRTKKDTRVIVSEYKGEISEKVKNFTETARDKDRKVFFYACGGDGTLNEAVNGVMRVENHENAAITHITRGSGNDFVKSFSNPKAFSEVSFFYEEKNIHEYDVDILEISSDLETKYGLNICSFGLDARIGTSIDRFRRSVFFPEKYAYMASAAINTVKGVSKPMTISLTETDGSRVKVEMDMTLACFCNGGHYGGSFTPIPDTKFNDGIIEALLVKKASRFEIARLMKIYGEGRYRELGGYAKRYSVREATITTAKNEPVNIDGELMISRETNVKILPKAIKFFAPKNTWVE